MRYRLLALDIDGTIRNTNRCITGRTRDAILRMQESGVCVAIASGRTAYAVTATVEELCLPRWGGYAISGNGAQIHNCKTGELLRETLLPAGFAGRIGHFCAARGLSLMGFDGPHLLTNRPDDPYVRQECEQDGMILTQVDDFAAYDAMRMPKFIIAADEPHLLALRPELDCCFGSEAAIFRSEPQYMELQAAGVSKGAAMQQIMSYLGCTAAETVACGNAYNDISMIEAAGVGAAVANAPEGVRACADLVTASCDADGVADLIDRLFFSAE